jgi:cation transport regulator ChaC
MDTDTLGIIVSLLGAAFVARQTYAHFIRNRAFAYIERFNHKDFMELRIAIEQWIVENPSPTSLSTLLKSKKGDDIAMSVQIRTYLNLFQELAVAFEKGMVDKHIFYRNFDFLIVSNWERFADFIYTVRALTGDFTIYKRFELMANEVKAAKKSDSVAGKIYVFGYGSLMLEESIHKSLQRTEIKYPLFDATLKGYTRGWDIVIDIFSDALQRPIKVLFLNIQKHSDGLVDGMIFSVTFEELNRIKEREVNYDCIEVTPLISSSILAPSDVVVTFVGQSEHLLDQCREPCYVMQRYLNVLEKIKPLNPYQYERMKESASFNAEVLEGTYSFPPKE